MTDELTTEEVLLLDAEEAQMEVLRRLAGCQYRSDVICGLWDKSPERCGRCEYNPNIIWIDVQGEKNGHFDLPGVQKKTDGAVRTD